MQVINAHTRPDEQAMTRCHVDSKVKAVAHPRTLMEEKLGRPLEPYENVHHKDGNSRNNEMGNLEVILCGEHRKEHNRAKHTDKKAI